MQVFERAAELLTINNGHDAIKLAFIPTMGALHEGHLSLVESAQNMGYKTIVSIFVNPLQFNNPEDLKKYPRTLEADLVMLENQGVDFVFIPTVQEMYPSEVLDIEIELGSLATCFEGSFRPGHFNGVIQVVYRLFKFVNPDVVFFGEKDLQQCLVIQQLNEQVFPNIKMYRVPTKREVSGLAMSSRNVRLSSASRKSASEIYKSLQAIVLNKENLCSETRNQTNRLTELGFTVEYMNCVSLPHMELLSCDYFLKKQAHVQPFAVVFAGNIDGVRLIDNLVF